MFSRARPLFFLNLDLVPAGPDSPAPGWEAKWIWRFLLLGLIARAVRFFLNFPLWDDESFLCVNFIDRGFIDLLQALDHHQVAPPLFLWIELAMVRLFGYSEMTLRLFPFLCGVSSLFLFRHLAGRLLRGQALVFAVALFAVAYPGIRYSAEAKQYGPDLLISLALLTLAVEWWRRPDQSRWLWALAALAPLAIGLSYPAVFPLGAISLAVAVVLLAGRQRGWLPWAVYNASMIAGCGVVFLLGARNQVDGTLPFMQDYWHQAFPPDSLLRLPGWLLVTHTSDLLAYPVGGGRGSCTLTFLCWVAGIVVLARSRQVVGLLLALGPMALNMTAAALHRYPYGGHVKFSQYAAPLICCLTGLGIASLLTWAGRRLRGPLPLYGVLVVLALVGVGSVVRDVRHPYKTESDQRARDFARWFWFNAAFKGEVVCVRNDLHQELAPLTTTKLTWEAMYRCNQRIYSPRRAGRPDLKRVAANWPLRCVVYEDRKCGFNERALADWLEGMRTRYELVGQETFPFPRFDKREKNLVKVDYLHVYRFVPKSGLVAAASPTAEKAQ